MYVLSPSQSVNDLRFYKSDGSDLLNAYGPGASVASLSTSPTTFVWLVE